MAKSKIESVDEFRTRARAWIEAELPVLDDPTGDHELQQRIYDAGFGGLAFPEEYGGAGLTLEHQKVFYDTVSELGRKVPTSSRYMVSIGMLGPTILDCASHEAKARFLPSLLRGDTIWMQLLSEPRGGSDMAGATTRITLDGDTILLNGAKMWSTGAHQADYGLCLCRSDWDVPKHRGLSMVALPLRGTAGLTIHQTRAADGTAGEFCEEFFDNVALPAENLIGGLNDGWAVAQRLLFHERNAVGGVGLGYLGHRAAESADPTGLRRARALASAAHETGVSAAVAIMVADGFIEETVKHHTRERIMRGMQRGTHQGPWGSLLKLQHSVAQHRGVRTELAVSGADAVIWDGEDVVLDNAGTAWLSARGSTIAGGTSEMQRNIISERLLGLPREPSSDRDVPFRDVVKNQGSGPGLDVHGR